MTIDQVMTTTVVCLREGHSLSDAQRAMEAAGVRHLPIVDDEQRVVGILSDRDICRILGSGRDERSAVGASMTRAVQVVRPNTPAHEAVRLFMELDIGALPVIDGDDRLVGLVTRWDFLCIARTAIRNARLQPKAPTVVDSW